MKNLSKHEKVAGALFIISILLMIISFCPGGWAEMTGILQGMSTGLLSGMVLLWITGIKGKEVKQLSNVCNFWIEVNCMIINSDELYSTLYHSTYHGKKDTMTFDEYLLIINDTYQKYVSLHRKLVSLDESFIPQKYQMPEFPEFITTFDVELQKIRLQIENADSKQSKADLNEVREMLYDLQHKIHPLYQMISQQIQQMHSKREHIENSFL